MFNFLKNIFSRKPKSFLGEIYTTQLLTLVLENVKVNSIKTANKHNARFDIVLTSTFDDDDEHKPRAMEIRVGIFHEDKEIVALSTNMFTYLCAKYGIIFEIESKEEQSGIETGNVLLLKSFKLPNTQENNNH